jgi:glycosyltransferase involved in cell wall biosynthesis
MRRWQLLYRLVDRSGAAPAPAQRRARGALHPQPAPGPAGLRGGAARPALGDEAGAGHQVLASGEEEGVDRSRIVEGDTPDYCIYVKILFVYFSIPFKLRMVDMKNKAELLIMIPVYNDWESVSILIHEIDTVFGHVPVVPTIVIFQNEVSDLLHIQRIMIIRLVRNLGHQKAIALGLAYITSNYQVDNVIIMDCDGEDRPSDILYLLDGIPEASQKIVFAQRSRRSEGWFFRLFYELYKLSFRLLTGIEISFGNFALIPASILARVVYLPDIWNHFAAGIIHARLPWRTIPTSRGTRYAGKSKMNFIALILHGLSSMSVFVEIMTARLIILVLGIFLFVFMAFLLLVYVRFFTPLAIPGWATSVGIGLIIITAQAASFLVLLSFVVLSYRTNKLFIPAKDYHDYIFAVEKAL